MRSRFRKSLSPPLCSHNLLVCAGTDFHGFDQPGLNQIAYEMPLEHWIPFRRAHKLPVPEKAAHSGGKFRNRTTRATS